jgi:Bacterial Ig domain
MSTSRARLCFSFSVAAMLLLALLPSAAVAQEPCPPTGTFSDDFEPDAMPGWTVDTVNSNSASFNWDVRPDPAANSLTNSFSSDASFLDLKEDRLISPPQDLSSTSKVIFWHQFSTEPTFDGGVLEVSTNGGTTWADVGAANFVAGGYNDVIDPGFGSPIAGQPAWTGDSPAFPGAMNRVEANLGGFAGSDRLIRWRLVLDPLVPGSIPGVAWWVDDVSFTNLVVNCPPIAVDDTATTVNGFPVTINVLANDSDPNGDPLTVTSVTDPPNGSVVNNGDGTVTYTPDCPVVLGNDTFMYTIDDGNGGTDTAMVTVRNRKTSRRGSVDPC